MLVNVKVLLRNDEGTRVSDSEYRYIPSMVTLFAAILSTISPSAASVRKSVTLLSLEYTISISLALRLRSIRKDQSPGVNRKIAVPNGSLIWISLVYGVVPQYGQPVGASPFCKSSLHHCTAGVVTHEAHKYTASPIKKQDSPKWPG